MSFFIISIVTSQAPAALIAQWPMCDPKNDVFFVCYQARGTRGRKIIEGKLPCRAGIYKLSGYSAHADQAMLVNWVKSMPKPPGQIRLVHGGSRARNALAKALGI